MKSLEEIREKYICPSCKSKKYLSFKNQNAHCSKCSKDFDLGMKLYD